MSLREKSLISFHKLTSLFQDIFLDWKILIYLLNRSARLCCWFVTTVFDWKRIGVYSKYAKLGAMSSIAGDRIEIWMRDLMLFLQVNCQFFVNASLCLERLVSVIKYVRVCVVNFGRFKKICRNWKMWSRLFLDWLSSKSLYILSYVIWIHFH